MKLVQSAVAYNGHMGDDMMVVNAARQSFNKLKARLDKSDHSLIEFLATGMSSAEWAEFMADLRKCDTDESLKRMLLEFKRKAQHWAPFGHPHLSLRIRMPIFLARQYVKHQVGGVWSEESRRYITDKTEFYTEPTLMTRPENIKQGAGGELPPEVQIQAAQVMRDVSIAARQAYEHLVHDLKIAPEQAREILTLNTMTGVTWTGSLLFWSRVCNQRLDPHAQFAAQCVARDIEAIAQPLFPVSWAALVR